MKPCELTAIKVAARRPVRESKLALWPWFFLRVIGLLAMANVQTVFGAAERFWLTNPPAVFQASITFSTNIFPAPRSFSPPSTNLPLEIRRAMLQFLAPQQIQIKLYPQTNLFFHHFFPESLSQLVWTNLLAHTNGRNTVIWSLRNRPPQWPESPIQARWNPQCLLWGMKGFTALSPSWEGEGYLGQIPITALTRRHGYTRGHHMGDSGFSTRLAGKRVWFLTKENQVIERKILRQVVRTVETDRLDYTIVLLDQDLPADIQPVRVAKPEDFSLNHPSRYPFCEKAPYVMYKTEQSGNVSAQIPGFTVDTWKGGDSGSPNLLPLPGELVFVSGRNTSGASLAMQADMDELCRLAGLKSAGYQLQWADLSAFPTY